MHPSLPVLAAPRLVPFTVATAGVLAVWNNAVAQRLPSYVLGNAVATAALLTAARRAGLSWDELGLGRPALRRGLRWGAAPGALVGAGYATALAVPALRPLLRDARVAGLVGAEVASRALVRIPVGTVLWEEVAFRGVLLAALDRLLGPRTAVGASSALFGVWHIRPAAEGLRANGLVRGPVGTAVAVGSACLGTAAAGVLFAELRRRSGSLVAPALLHGAANVLGLLAAVRASRRSLL
ncbi:CPBP family intramembrane glutamic endopeptidase [Blastococcus sp. PRF04-17]|uniref:CPBP family intramembrane glutamic endopeptidase n=1 Tax=Blastococcus sp. PRF04-17 TaxID=2933797 RepID=UPI001FF2A51B|nr:CPBP family intramembrane glutamic endopeptidase [Blastococcus sp. PRF04-17]UOY02411.1 CPBP family intramembrane metalloprotease [Blastococcus sp. PRF04-17]